MGIKHAMKWNRVLAHFWNTQSTICKIKLNKSLEKNAFLLELGKIHIQLQQQGHFRLHVF